MNPAVISQMLRALSVSEAPVTKAGLATVVEFFAGELRIHLESQSHWQQWIEYLIGIDLHQRIVIETLPAGTQLSRHEPSGGRPKPFVYYTRPGTSQFRTGTSFPTSTFKLFQFVRPTRALVSKAAGIKFGDPNIVRAGGGVQYIVSSSALTTIVHTQQQSGPRTR